MKNKLKNILNYKMPGKKVLKTIGIILIITASVIIILDEIAYRSYSYGEEAPFSDKACNVAGIELYGDLLTYYDSEHESADDVSSVNRIKHLIEDAEAADNIEVILLEIDSYGGFPVATEEIANAIKRSTGKPVIAQIREAGISAAYWAASAADVVFASELSEIGGIGVSQSYLDSSRFNQREGYVFNELNTAKFKDMLNPDKSLTTEERALIERDLEIVHEAFVNSVARNRGMDKEDVEKLADGSTMLGKMALENGLIDKIGGSHEIENYLRAQYDIEPVVCW